ncbi:DUF2306 domain-containing protein [Prescottella soli]|uniref:DUF2306 domain-containing protein n=1 Tax=Prescottella soli TaxID=1543852 RepID=A0ABW9FPQ0_9NOCA
MTLSAVGIALFSVIAYLSGDPARSRIPIDPEIATHYLSVVAHALPASLALLIGPFQFATPLRNSFPRVHRILGRVYMVSIVFATIAAVFATAFTLDGVPVQVGFTLLIAAWTYTLVQGYRTIRRGQVQLHRIWMIRNYSLTFAAVLLRAFLGLGLALQRSFPGLTFAEIYSSSVWASVLICVIVPEYFILQRSPAPRAAPRGRRENTRSTNAAAIPVRSR